MELTWNALSMLLVCDVRAVIFSGKRSRSTRLDCLEFPVLYYHSVCLHLSCNISVITKPTDLKPFCSSEEEDKICLVAC